MSLHDFKPIQNLFGVTISSTKYAKNRNTDVINLHVFNISPSKITLPLEVLGYCEPNAIFYPTQEKTFRFSIILKLLDICHSKILNEELYINNITKDSKKTPIFSQNSCFKPTFQISKYTNEQNYY